MPVIINRQNRLHLANNQTLLIPYQLNKFGDKVKRLIVIVCLLILTYARTVSYIKGELEIVNTPK